MATIKATGTGTNKRIVTKLVNGQRRVSCSCCEEEGCCMYPAQALADGLFTEEDLPDSVFIASSGSNDDFREATRDGVNFIIENGFSAGEDIVLGLNGNTWGLWVEAGSGPEFIIGDYNGICLINWPYSEFDRSPAIQDNFADTYTAIGYSGVEIPVNRTGLCIWEGSAVVGEFTHTAILYYGGGGFEAVPQGNFKWNLSIGVSPLGGSSAGTKADPQNSPIGTYTDPISLEVFYVNP